MKKALLFLALVATQGVPVLAQDSPLDADSVVCSSAEAFIKWEAPHSNSVHLKMNVDGIASRLGAACTTQPDFSDTERSMEWARWLLRVDGIIEDIDRVVAQRFAEPIAARERPAIAFLLDTSARLQADIMSLRVTAYTVERIRVSEVTHTVEVPVPCPEIREPVNPCENTLRQSATAWGSQLREWTEHYQGSGEDWQLAHSSGPELLAISRGQNEPVPYLLGWLAQWRRIQRDDNTSFFGSGPMERISIDMRAKLNYCGYHVGGNR